MMWSIYKVTPIIAADVPFEKDEDTAMVGGKRANRVNIHPSSI
jgi:hypothetical protein